jgi:hypothetical protein
MVRISVASNVVDLLMVCRVCCEDILTAAVEPALDATCGRKMLKRCIRDHRGCKGKTLHETRREGNREGGRIKCAID